MTWNALVQLQAWAYNFSLVIRVYLKKSISLLNGYSFKFKPSEKQNSGKNGVQTFTWQIRVMTIDITDKTKSACSTYENHIHNTLYIVLSDTKN